LKWRYFAAKVKHLSEHNDSIHKMADHLFRHEAGKMVAVLTRIFGLHNLELAEDVVQEAFGKALKDWTFKIPDNPSAWLMQTAKNKAIDVVRRQRYQKEFSQEASALLKSEYTAIPTIENFFMDHEIQDSQLRMIFACCHPALSEADQISLTLKTCSGFGVHEIATALLSNDEVIKKRLQRAKNFIITENIQFNIPTGGALSARLDTVLHTIYLIFNEGYNSSSKENLIRQDLCEEAMRLTLLLTENSFTNYSKCYALLALLTLQASRFEARLDEGGDVILLEEQDRSKWSRELIDIGLNYLERSMRGSELSEYHLEAAIVAEHARVRNFSETDWVRILSLYETLASINSSPMVLLNKAIVSGKIKGPQNAIDEMMHIPDIEKLLDAHYLFAATMGEMHRQLDRKESAREFLLKALDLTQSIPERKLLHRKLALL
jgi:RNA polymerase sigma factor (sigma-70 family)